MDLADFMGTPRVIKDSFGHRCFSGIDMGNNADISNLIYGIFLFHGMANILTVSEKRTPAWPFIKGRKLFSALRKTRALYVKDVIF